MASPLLTKYVEFKAKGLGDLKRETKQYTTAAKDAAKMVDSFKKAIDSGAYAKQTRELAAARRELEGYARAYARLGLDARYGRLGGGMAYYAQRAINSPLAGAVGYGATAAAGAGLASARAGFAGTLSQSRLDYQQERINRQMAAALTPAMDALTKVMERVASHLERIGPGGQNALMAGTLGVGAAAAVGGASRLMGGPGLGAMLAGGAGWAGRGLSLAGRGLGWAAGLGTASSAGGGVASLGMGLTGGLAAAGGGLTMYSVLGRERQDRVADKISPFGTGVTRGLQGMADMLPTAGTIASFFGGGESRRSFAKTAGERLSRLFDPIFGGGLGTPTDPTARRQPPPLVGGGFDQAGGSWYRMHEAYQRTGGGSGTGDLEEAMAALTKELKRANDREGKPDLR